MDYLEIYRLTWLVLWLLGSLALGAAVGSFLNVCVARLPYEKSLLWPGSHCGSCFQPIALQDNQPLLGYLRLRGRCRYCGARFSIGYFLVELFTGLTFAVCCYLLLFANIQRFPSALEGFQTLGPSFVLALPIAFHHITLICFLIVTSLCDLRHMEIPLSVTVTGTFVGLILAVLLPWPYPEPNPPPWLLRSAWEAARTAQPAPYPPYPGVYPWPVWYPLPSWMPPGSWQLGLATGLAGALAGMILLRGVRFLFGLGRGLEGLGEGDADLMMMAGAFVGWQPVVVAFFVSVFPALFFGIFQLIRRGDQALPFGPPLAVGVVISLLGWPMLGPQFQLLFFDPLILLILGGAGAVFLFLTAFLLRLLRGTPAAGA